MRVSEVAAGRHWTTSRAIEGEGKGRHIWGPSKIDVAEWKLRMDDREMICFKLVELLNNLLTEAAEGFGYQR